MKTIISFKSRYKLGEEAINLILSGGKYGCIALGICFFI